MYWYRIPLQEWCVNSEVIIEVQSSDKNVELRKALGALLPSVYRVLSFSLFTNILVLASSWYMMEVYDRVVNSRSHVTLLMLTLCVVFAYLLLEALDWIRLQIMQEAGDDFDRAVHERVFGAMFTAQLHRLPMAGGQSLRDLRTVREFFASRAMLSIFDVPFALLVLVIIFWMHPFLGWVAVIGALIQFGIGLLNEHRIREALFAANRGATLAQGYAEGMLRNAEVIESMGMMPSIRERWVVRQQEFLMQQAEASDHAGANAAFSKLVQSLLSSMILGFGCWLTIKGELHGSAMIVASILGGKVLSPLVQLIAGWRQVAGVMESWQRLGQLLDRFPAPLKGMALPAPSGMLNVDNVIAGSPGNPAPILKGIKFSLQPGASLAVVGPSASGKTTLARLLVGIWPSAHGKIRLDGSDVFLWDKDELGKHVGYLPQNIELFDGTIAENIARFGTPDLHQLDMAVRMVALDSFIATLTEGYNTRIGEDGAFLSGGERQRIALARAVYGMPSYVVLDEPDSSLDEAGEAALLRTISKLKANGSTVIIMTHKLQLLQAVDFMLLLVDGQVQRFGPRSEVLDGLRSDARAHSSKIS